MGVAQITIDGFSAVLGPEPLVEETSKRIPDDIQPAINNYTVEQLDGMMFNATRKL